MTDVLRGERAVLLDYLEHYRTTFARQVDGLEPEQLAARAVPPSNLSLLGLLRHLAKVEHSWCRRVVEAQPDLDRLFRTPAQPDLDFEGAVAEPWVVGEALTAWRREADHAREVYAVTPLGQLCPHPDGELEVREVLVHLIEEYARHCGHADLLREVVDGTTGL